MIKWLLTLFLITTISNADTIKIGGSSLKMDYVETDRSGSFLDSETTSWDQIGGVELGYSKPMGKGHGGADESALELNLRYLKGESNYNGFLQSSTGTILSPYSTTTDIEIFEPELRWVETKHTQKFDVSSFVSLGYRYWLRDNSHDPFGYKEEYKWKYFNLGIKSLFHDKNWDIGFEIAYQRAIDPTLFADINGGLNFDLGVTDGYYYKIPLIYHIDDKYSLELSYKYDYWKIRESNVVGGFYEPESKTKNQIIAFSIVIKF